MSQYQKYAQMFDELTQISRTLKVVIISAAQPARTRVCVEKDSVSENDIVLVDYLDVLCK
jgi:hypothetical protein